MKTRQTQGVSGVGNAVTTLYRYVWRGRFISRWSSFELFGGEDDTEAFTEDDVISDDVFGDQEVLECCLLGLSSSW